MSAVQQANATKQAGATRQTSAVQQASAAAPPAAGSVVYKGHCYDRQLRRCRIYAVANGQGGMEWRVVRESIDADADSEVERCFRSYQEAIKWIA